MTIKDDDMELSAAEEKWHEDRLNDHSRIFFVDGRSITFFNDKETSEIYLSAKSNRGIMSNKKDAYRVEDVPQWVWIELAEKWDNIKGPYDDNIGEPCAMCKWMKSHNSSCYLCPIDAICGMLQSYHGQLWYDALNVFKEIYRRMIQ